MTEQTRRSIHTLYGALSFGRRIWFTSVSS